jgi:hypothetical protein
MQLRRPGQSERWRVAVFATVVGLHLVVGSLLLAAGTVRIVRPRAGSALALLSLPQESHLKIPAALPASTPTLNSRRRESSPDIDLPVGVAEPEPNNPLPCRLICALTPRPLRGDSRTRRRVKDAGEILPGRRNHSLRGGGITRRSLAIVTCGATVSMRRVESSSLG